MDINKHTESYQHDIIIAIKDENGIGLLICDKNKTLCASKIKSISLYKQEPVPFVYITQEQAEALLDSLQKILNLPKEN